MVMLWALDVHAHPEENCKGHADFLVFNNAKRIVSVAEAKLLRRKGYYLAGIDQLVGYMTTREACGVMIGFRHESSTVDFLPSLIHSITSGDCDGIVITELTPEEFHFTSRCSHPRGTEVTVLHFLADI